MAAENHGTEIIRSRFGELYDRHREEVLRLVRRKLGRNLRRRLESEDALQDVFLEALRLYADPDRRPRENAEDFRRWLAAIAENKVRNLARDHIGTQRRSLRRERRLTSSAVERIDNPRTERASAAAEREELRRTVLAALGSLSPRQQEVIRLVRLEGRSVQEAAKSMRKSANATSVLLFQALHRLGRRLREGDA